MGSQSTVATTPAQLVRAPTSYGLHQRITVTNGAGGATLVSLLSGGVLPAIPVPNISGPANLQYQIGYVQMQAETDPATVAVRYTCDGQTTPTSTLGFVVPGQPNLVTLPCDPKDIKLISAGANVNIQVYLGITAVSS